MADTRTVRHIERTDTPVPTFSASRWKMKQRKAGFTIVELLVVIGVLAVLVSILIPAVSRARESSRIAQCMSNLRQFGEINTMYCAQNKGFLFPCKCDDHSQDSVSPPFYGCEMVSMQSGAALPPIINEWLNIGVKNSSGTWSLAKGVQYTGIWTCPDQISGQGNSNDQFLQGYGCNESVHVLYNYAVTGTTATPRKPLRRLTQIHRPSEVCQMMDVSQVASAFAASPYLAWSSDIPTESPQTGELTSSTPSNASKGNYIVTIESGGGWNVQTDNSGTYVGRFRHGKLDVSPTRYDPASNVTRTFQGGVGYSNVLFVDGHVESVNYMNFKLKNLATWY